MATSNNIRQQRLTVIYDSAQTTLLQELQAICPRIGVAGLLVPSFCQTVFGKYQLLLTGNENHTMTINDTYVDETQSAVDNGLLQQYFEQVNPSSAFLWPGQHHESICQAKLSQHPPQLYFLPILLRRITFSLLQYLKPPHCLSHPVAIPVEPRPNSQHCLLHLVALQVYPWHPVCLRNLHTLFLGQLYLLRKKTIK